MKRRDFIGKTLIGTSGMALGSSGLLPVSALGANDKVVLAIIGSGSRGTSTIINTCKINSNVEIKTVCDVNDLKAARAIELIEKELGYKPPHQKNMNEVFDDKDIDAVWISTPEHWHALATVWACQAGKDVYVQKPLTFTITEAEKIVRVVNDTMRVVQVGSQQRSSAEFQKAIELVQSGAIGHIDKIY